MAGKSPLTASSGRSGPTTTESRRHRPHRSTHFCRAPREGNYGSPASRSPYDYGGPLVHPRKRTSRGVSTAPLAVPTKHTRGRGPSGQGEQEIVQQRAAVTRDIGHREPPPPRGTPTRRDGRGLLGHLGMAA